MQRRMSKPGDGGLKERLHLALVYSGIDLSGKIDYARTPIYLRSTLVLAINAVTFVRLRLFLRTRTFQLVLHFSKIQALKGVDH